MSLFYSEDENSKTGMSASIALCTLGAIIGFEHGTWWSITLGVISALGVVSTIILMFINKDDE